MRRLYVVLLALLALVVAAPVAAHQDTVAYSRMVIRENGDVEYALKIPVEDLSELLGRRDHAALNAPEVRGAEGLLFRHFQPLLGMTSGGAACPVERNGIEVPEDERLYGELRFVFHCPAGAAVTLDYRVFFDTDPGHVGMLEVETPGGKTRAELIVERPRWAVEAPTDGPPRIRAVEPSAALPIERSTPITGANSIATDPSRTTQAPLAVLPDARRVSKIEEPAKPAKKARSSYGNWLPIAVVLVAATGAAFIAVRGARRRVSL